MIAGRIRISTFSSPIFGSTGRNEGARFDCFLTECCTLTNFYELNYHGNWMTSPASS
jgi:hypothetical protein